MPERRGPERRGWWGGSSWVVSRSERAERSTAAYGDPLAKATGETQTQRWVGAARGGARPPPARRRGSWLPFPAAPILAHFPRLGSNASDPSGAIRRGGADQPQPSALDAFGSGYPRLRPPDP